MGATDEGAVHTCECPSRSEARAQVLIIVDKQIFGVPPQARRAKPFIDHILTFSILDSKIWFRNFQVRHGIETEISRVFILIGKLLSLMQIVEKDPLQPNGPPEMSLVEIGPRFVLTPIRIFEGAFGGATVFANPGTHYFAAAGIVVGLVVFKAFRFFRRVRISCACEICETPGEGRKVQGTQACAGRTWCAPERAKARGGPTSGGQSVCLKCTGVCWPVTLTVVPLLSVPFTCLR